MKNKGPLFVALLLASGGCRTALLAAETPVVFHVSPQGSDSNPGTKRSEEGSHLDISPPPAELE